MHFHRFGWWLVALAVGCGGSREPIGGLHGEGRPNETGGGGGVSGDGATAGHAEANVAGAAGEGAATGGLSNMAGASGCGVPSAFKWTSSGALISPQSDVTHGIASIKDPTIVFHEGKWHVYATAYNTTTSTFNMVYLNFADFAEAATAPHYYMDRTPGFGGYRCAPQIFYFAPQAKWYLIYQTQPPAYSTTTDPSKPETWSSARNFYSGEPEIVTQNKGDGTWIDFWIICDDLNCHMFFSDDNGHLYRSQTAKSDFPNGFGAPVIALRDTKFALFEAANVYKIKGSTKFLLIVEAIGNGRYFRSWTADALDGNWTPLADTQAKAFASQSNVTGASWSNDGISHGEMLRDGNDESLTVDTCNMRYLYQGRTKAGTSYNLHEYSLGLLTSTP